MYSMTACASVYGYSPGWLEKATTYGWNTPVHTAPTRVTRNQINHARSLGSTIQRECRNDASAGPPAPGAPPAAPAHASDQKDAALSDAARDIHSPDATGMRAPVPPPELRCSDGRRPSAYAAPASARMDESPPAVGVSMDDLPDASDW